MAEVEEPLVLPKEILNGLATAADRLDKMGGSCPACGVRSEMFRYLPAAEYYNLGGRCTGLCKLCGIGPWEDIL